MTSISTNTDYLISWSNKFEEAAALAVAATAIPDGVAHDCEGTHGVVSDPSNDDFAAAETGQTSAGQAISEACSRLANALRIAADMYNTVDNASAESLSRHMPGS